MPPSTAPLSSPAEFLRLARHQPLRWLVPMSLVTVAAVAYAVLRKDTWEAAQTLIVRNEAAGNLDEAGKFVRSEDLKVVQETILEIATNQELLRETLAEVGRPADAVTEAAEWPSPLDVETLGKAVDLAPPKGAEFGKTEVIYLKAKDSDRQRALDLVATLRARLMVHFQQLRDAKARSMIDELSKAVSLAEADLTASTAKLSRLEQSVGLDLAELRLLHDSASGDGDLRRSAQELETELREAQLEEKNAQALLQLLDAASVDPGRLLATPARLIVSQPALERLKEGLVTAQLHTADLAGAMSDRHPLVQAAREAEQDISRQLHDELTIALRGVTFELSLASDRVRSLGAQYAEARRRLEHVAGLRAEYANLVADVQHRTRLLEAAQKQLSEALASQAGAHSASLIAAIDEPSTGPRPLGPGRTLTALAGLMGGLVIGAGVLFLSLPAVPRAADGAAIPLPPSWPQLPVEDRPRNYPPCGGLSFEKVFAKCGRRVAESSTHSHAPTSQPC